MSDAEQETPEAICERLVWSHNPVALAQAPDALPESWGGSVQAEVRTFGVKADTAWPLHRCDPYLRAAAIMMVKDEGDVIGENLRWLYFIGVRRFLVLDNQSTDGTAHTLAVLKEVLPDVELLVLADPTVRYMQAQKMTGLFRLAISVWPDLRWVFPADADEFLIPQRGFGALDTIPDGVDAVTIPKSIHFQNKIQRWKEQDTFFERMDLCSPIFEVPPKIILRANLDLSITQGNHKVARAGGNEVYDGGFKHGLYFREYPVRSFEHFLRKTRNGGRAIRAAEAFLGHSVGGGHWLEAYELLQAEGEQALMRRYQNNWISDAHERFRFKAFRGAGSLSDRPVG